MKIIEALRGHPGELTKKDLRKRMIIVVILALVGVFFIWRGVQGYAGIVPGWETIDQERIVLSSGEKIYPHYGDIKLHMYFKDRDSKGLNYRPIKAIYDATTTKTFQLSDVERDYDDVHNLKYINDRPGEEIVVEPYLYNALKKAYAYSVETDGIYNIFAGDVYLTLWEEIYGTSVSLSELEEKTALAEDKAYAQLQRKDSLVFNDERSSVIFNSTGTKLHLQALQYAFAAEELKAQLSAGNYTFGYISGADGLYIALGDHPQATTWTIDLNDPAYTGDRGEVSAWASMYQDGAFNCFVFDKIHGVNAKTIDNKTIHLLYSARKNTPPQKYPLALLLAPREDAADLVIETLRLINDDDVESAENTLRAITDENVYGVISYSDISDDDTSDLTLVVSAEGDKRLLVRYNEEKKKVLTKEGGK